MNDDYSDIIDLPHHVSKRHKPMSMLNRAAQFAPFAALTGHNDAIAETARQTDSLVDLDGDVAASLDQKLVQLQASMTVTGSARPATLTYFKPDSRKEGGSYLTVTATVKRIDDTARQLVLADGTSIPLAHIIDLAP